MGLVEEGREKAAAGRGGEPAVEKEGMGEAAADEAGDAAREEALSSFRFLTCPPFLLVAVERTRMSKVERRPVENGGTNLSPHRSQHSPASQERSESPERHRYGYGRRERVRMLRNERKEIQTHASSSSVFAPSRSYALCSRPCIRLSGLWSTSSSV
jgi:hypothetical protein